LAPSLNQIKGNGPTTIRGPDVAHQIPLLTANTTSSCFPAFADQVLAPDAVTCRFPGSTSKLVIHQSGVGAVDTYAETNYFTKFPTEAAAFEKFASCLRASLKKAVKFASGAKKSLLQQIVIPWIVSR
jgi:hypothetical protein